MQILIGLLATIATIVAGLLTWWINNNPRIRMRKLLDKIERLENEFRKAVEDHNTQRMGELQLELVRLRLAQEALAKL